MSNYTIFPRLIFSVLMHNSNATSSLMKVSIISKNAKPQIWIGVCLKIILITFQNKINKNILGKGSKTPVTENVRSPHYGKRPAKKLTEKR